MVSQIIWMLLIAISPFIELRGAIPYGIASELNPWLVFSLTTFANILIIPVLFFLLEAFLEKLFQSKRFNHHIRRIMDRAHRKAEPYLDKYGYLGLTILVAIPLPVTGVYTATLVSHFLEMERKKAMLAIAVGVVIAGILVTLASVGILSFLKIFIFQ